MAKSVQNQITDLAFYGVSEFLCLLNRSFRAKRDIPEYVVAVLGIDVFAVLVFVKRQGNVHRGEAEHVGNGVYSSRFFIESLYLVLSDNGYLRLEFILEPERCKKFAPYLFEHVRVDLSVQELVLSFALS